MTTKYTLIPPELMATIPPLYATDSIPFDEKTVVAKLFCASFTWYIVEGEAEGTEDESFIMFAYVENHNCPDFSEWGYVSLDELESLTLENQRRQGKFLGTYIERDLHTEMGKPIGHYVTLKKRGQGR